MAIPAPLAFPPTALRNISAGLVVGNPVGSSGTRAKALTSAELKAIVEASGISYLPLAGGTLTGPITGTGGLIEQRNGLTAQCFDVFETYTSGTNNGKLRFKASLSGHQIGSARATSGSNRAVAIGHFDASDVFTSGMSVDTDGAITVAQRLGLGGAPNSATVFHSRSTVTRQFLFNRTEIGTTNTDGTYFSCGGSGEFTILNQENSTLRLGTNGDIVLTLSGTATLLAGQLTHVPPASVSLGTNGYFSIEMTSNTAGNLVYRGSDGTTRRMALTFS
jgi:hypothetical protein